MEIPHTPIFYILFVVVAVAIGIVEYNAEDTRQVQANMDNIDFLFAADKVIRDIVGEQINRSANNTDKITALQDYDKIITLSIGDIREDIKNKFPHAADVTDQGQSSSSTTPFLTLKMDKKDFVLGNVVFFMGTAQPNDPIFITLKDPDRILKAIPVSKTEIIGGSYIANYTLRLDDPIGTWQVYARQTSDQTKTLTFKVE